MLKGVLDKFRFYWIEIKVHGLGYYVRSNLLRVMGRLMTGLLFTWLNGRIMTIRRAPGKRLGRWRIGPFLSIGWIKTNR